jgi:tetratricopeptide (TPR) repeat protein
MTRTHGILTRTFTLLFLLVSLCPSSPEIADASDLKEADRLFTFAGSLMEEEDYYRAITEYKRFLSYFPDDERVPLCRFNIALAYQHGGKTDLAVEHLQQIRDEYAETEIAERASYEIGTSYFQKGRHEDAAEAFSEFLKNYPESNRLDQGRVLLGWSLLHRWELKEAVRTFFEVSEKSSQYPFAQAIAEEIEGGIALQKKSPVLAGTLSAIIPGTGQIYTGRNNEGVTSFILNGTFIWAIAELFSHSNEAAGLLLGFFEVGWYSGGIFGAVNDAHKFNRKARADYIEELQNRYPLPPGMKTGYLLQK